MFFSGFKGGIHPPDRKEQTKNCPVKELEPTELMTFIMAQGGKPCTPCVAIGDKVLKGQVIGDSKEFMSAPVHSSVSGTVEKIDKVLSPRGDMAEAVIIRNDFEDKEASVGETFPVGYVSKDELIGIVRNAGMVGMGGAGFPTHVKLSTDKKIDTVIINAAECEPYLNSDYRTMVERPDDMIDGLDLLLHAFGIFKGIIAIEDNKADAAKILKDKLRSNMQIKVLKTRYPQGSEKQLIYSVTERKVPEGGLPADIGVLVFNVDTVSSMSRAVRSGIPVTRRVVTVAGLALKEPGNFLVRIGTPFWKVFEAAGGFVCQPKKIVMGGPMMGIAQCSIDIPVTKTCSGLLALTDDDIGTKEEMPCLRCGRCISACPMGLMPVVLNKLVNKKEWDEAEKGGIMNCIECGCCAYSCPSDRNPASTIRRGKSALRAKR
ncbi:MAG: electron transport complex subunit RsxC [Bacillota bacterium]|nr:electron transport complex subunit RsxC [Bacillota bacterium]